MSIDASQQTVEKKMEALEQKFEKEIKESMNYIKSIETENKDPKDKLGDLKDWSQRDNLHFDGITEYENESMIPIKV